MNAPARSVQCLPPASVRVRSVLIIDDDPVFAVLASETLQQAGYDVRIAGTTQEAFAALEQAPPDLVLLDVDLPGGNGFEVCATLRAMSLGVDMPIVMVTGHDDTDSIAKAYQVGATDFIHKPVLWPTLPHRIGFMLRALDNMRALRLSEQKNRALLQALPDTIYMVDANAVVVEHITGNEERSGESLVGKVLEEVFPPEVARAARLSLSGLATAAMSSFEFETVLGKEQRWVEARLRPQADGPLLIIARDTTERPRPRLESSISPITTR